MSFQRLQDENPMSIRLIRFLVFLNPDEILIESLRAGSSAVDEDLRRLIEDEVALTDALNALCNFSLIRIWGAERKISIHRLVQAVVKDNLSETEVREIVTRVELSHLFTAFSSLNDEVDNVLIHNRLSKSEPS